MQSGKRHPLGYGQPSNHTPSPTMPRGRSQAREDAFRHNTTVRGLMQEYTLRSDATNPRRSACIPPNAINSSNPPNVSKNRHPLGYPQPPSLTLVCLHPFLETQFSNLQKISRREDFRLEQGVSPSYREYQTWRLRIGSPPTHGSFSTGRWEACQQL
ncbi:hypothetical protein EDD15DRAFT_2269294 [Pisolithus albus]|nr:hypothetical protein EDD15DRAFT_2269294 [Pisolithus albus]